MKISLLHGAVINAGDFLIKERAMELLKYVIKSVEIKEYCRLNSLQEELDEINKSDLVIIAGGPGYCNGFYPGMANFVSSLDEIKVPMMCMGMGWWSQVTTPMEIYRYVFADPMKELLNKASNKGQFLGCRDWFSVNVLRNNGYKNAILTGCPAWYNLKYINKLNYSGKSIEKANKVCISDCANIQNSASAYILAKSLREFFGDVEIVYVCHRGMPKKELQMDVLMNSLGIKIVDISGSSDGFGIYDDCDIHIGFRVHAHIYNLSRRNLSILIEEDSRGMGVNDALGLPHINAMDIVDNGGKTSAKINEIIPIQVEDAILNLISSNYRQIENAYNTMNRYFESMKEYVLSIEKNI